MILLPTLKCDQTFDLSQKLEFASELKSDLRGTAG